MANTTIPSELIQASVALGGSPTTTTQSASDNTTKIATTAYVTAAVNALIDSAPGTMNTLNEIAAALNDDAAFNTTVTNAIATKLPLGGGTMTGNLIVNASLDISGDIDVDGTTNLDIVDIDGAVNMATTALVTGVLTTTAATVFNGGFTANEVSTISDATSFSSGLTIANTGDTHGSVIDFFNNSDSPADNDYIGGLIFKETNSAGGTHSFGKIFGMALDITDGTEDGAITFETSAAGANTAEIMRITNTGVGIGSTSPSQAFEVHPNDDYQAVIGRARIGDLGYDDFAGFGHFDTGADYAILQYHTGETYINASSGRVINFRINNATKMVVNSTGVVSIGNTENTGYSDDYLVQVGTDGSGSNSFGMLIRANQSGISKLGFADGADADGTGKVWYDHASNYMRFDTAGSQKMKIHASGCIDLGANVDRSIGTNITTTVTSGSAGSGFWLSTGNSSATSSKIYTINNGSVGELIINNGGGNAGGIKFCMNASATPTTAQTKMTLLSNGRLMLGQSAHYNASINMNADPNIPAIETKNSTSGAIHYALFFRNSGGNEIGFIKISNTGTTYDTGSDYRLKENVEPIENGLERLNQLNPVQFDWKADGTSSEGFIAHEVQEIFPDAVSGEKDSETMQGMDYGRITPLLVKAIQEQQTLIESLTARIETLEG